MRVLSEKPPDEVVSVAVAWLHSETRLSSPETRHRVIGVLPQRNFRLSGPYRSPVCAIKKEIARAGERYGLDINAEVIKALKKMPKEDITQEDEINWITSLEYAFYERGVLRSKDEIRFKFLELSAVNGGH